VILSFLRDVIDTPDLNKLSEDQTETTIEEQDEKRDKTKEELEREKETAEVKGSGTSEKKTFEISMYKGSKAPKVRTIGTHFCTV
jgi:hypothetical protein